MPANLAPKISDYDKVEHGLAFVSLALIAVFAFQGFKPLAVAVALSAFGALIELVQAIPMLHRDCDFWDWATDTVAVAIVFIPVSIARSRRLQQNKLLEKIGKAVAR